MPEPLPEPLPADPNPRVDPRHATAGDPPAVLDVASVTVTYPGRRGARPAVAVDGVDLELRRGEITALVGESGSGKTSLARAIVGLQPLAGGAINLDGALVDASRRGPTGLRRRVQIVFQDPTSSLNPRHTIGDIVAEGLRIHRRRGDEARLVAEALASCGLRPPERFIGRFPHELSGGQRQRVAIAGAMVLEPEVLIADEPVSSLDASVRGEILALLADLARSRSMAVLVVTHDLGLAWNIADRVAVMYLGRIVELGPADEVLTAPRHPYTRALLAVSPERLAGGPPTLHGEAPDPTAIPSGCRFHPRCPVVQSGEAERLGVLHRCLADDPRLAAEGVHRAACHLPGPVDA